MSKTLPAHRDHRSPKSFRGYLRSHSLGAFRALLLGGNLLLFILLLGVEIVSPHSQRYLGWLAGLAATLGMLFLFTMWSTRVTGHRRYRDPWLSLATAMIFVLSVVFTIIALFHLPV